MCIARFTIAVLASFVSSFVLPAATRGEAATIETTYTGHILNESWDIAGIFGVPGSLYLKPFSLVFTGDTEAGTFNDWGNLGGSANSQPSVTSAHLSIGGHLYEFDGSS